MTSNDQPKTLMDYCYPSNSVQPESSDRPKTVQDYWIDYVLSSRIKSPVNNFMNGPQSIDMHPNFNRFDDAYSYTREPGEDIYATLTRRSEALECQGYTQLTHAPAPMCTACEAPNHVLEKCPYLRYPTQTRFIQGSAINERYMTEPYNPVWENHSNFMWSQDATLGDHNFDQSYPMHSQALNNQPGLDLEEGISPLEKALDALAKSQDDTSTILNNFMQTRSEIFEKSEWREEPLPSSPYLPIAPSPSALELPIVFTRKGEPRGAKMELIKTSQGSQIQNTAEEATHKILPHDSLNPCLAHLEVDDFDIDGCVTEMNDLVEIPHPNITPLLIEKYEPSPNPPIAPLLESPPDLKLKPLPVTSMDILPEIYDQEAQVVGILKEHKKAIGWDIDDIKDNDYKTLISDFSEFGTTFDDCLQNLSAVLKLCMETELILIWKKCQVIDQKGIMPRLELLTEPLMTLVEPLPKKEEASNWNPEILPQSTEHIEYIDLGPLESRLVLKLYLDLMIENELLAIRGMSYLIVSCRKYSEDSPESRRELQTYVKIRAGIG